MTNESDDELELKELVHKLVVFQELPSGAKVKAYQVDKNGRGMTIHLHRNRILMRPNLILLAMAKKKKLLCQPDSHEWVLREKALGDAINSHYSSISSSTSSVLDENSDSLLSFDLRVDFQDEVQLNKQPNFFHFKFDEMKRANILPLTVALWEFDIKLPQQEPEQNLSFRASIDSHDNDSSRAWARPAYDSSRKRNHSSATSNLHNRGGK